MNLLRGLLALLLLAVLAAAGWLGWQWTVRPGMAEYQAHLAPPADPADPLTATWLGTTALLIRDGERAILIDPFFTRPQGVVNLLLNRAIAPDPALIRRWLDRLGVQRLDAVLVSHSHFDHAMDAGLVAQMTGAQLIGSASTAHIGRGAGLAESQLQVVTPGAEIVLGPFTVRFIESPHAGATGGRPLGEISEPLRPPARYLDYRLGGSYSIHVAHPRGALLHHGSAGYRPGALRGLEADLVFLGIALRPELGPYLDAVVHAVGAQRVIPTHWDDFTRGLDAPLRPAPLGLHLDRFFAEMAGRHAHLQVQTLALGQPYTLFPATAAPGDLP